MSPILTTPHLPDHTIHNMPIPTHHDPIVVHNNLNALNFSTPAATKSFNASGSWNASSGFEMHGGGCVTAPHHEVCINGNIGNSWGISVGGSASNNNATIGGSISAGPHGISGGTISGTINW